MKKILIAVSLISICGMASAEGGVYIGGGIGYGIQDASYLGTANTSGTPAMRAQVGYQLADWMGAELGWNYITQAQNWNNLGNQSSTIYDLSFLPGFTLPATPVTIFVRLGIDAVSTNLNNSWYNQLISNSSANFEYGAGVKVSIPGTNTFVRGEYINYGGSPNNNNSSLSVTPSALLIDASYVF